MLYILVFLICLGFGFGGGILLKILRRDCFWFGGYGFVFDVVVLNMGGWVVVGIKK